MADISGTLNGVEIRKLPGRSYFTIIAIDGSHPVPRAQPNLKMENVVVTINGMDVADWDDARMQSYLTDTRIMCVETCSISEYSRLFPSKGKVIMEDGSAGVHGKKLKRPISAILPPRKKLVPSASDTDASATENSRGFTGTEASSRTEPLYHNGNHGLQGVRNGLQQGISGQMLSVQNAASDSRYGSVSLSSQNARLQQFSEATIYPGQPAPHTIQVQILNHLQQAQLLLSQIPQHQSHQQQQQMLLRQLINLTVHACSVPQTAPAVPSIAMNQYAVNDGVVGAFDDSSALPNSTNSNMLRQPAVLNNILSPPTRVPVTQGNQPASIQNLIQLLLLQQQLQQQQQQQNIHYQQQNEPDQQYQLHQNLPAHSNEMQNQQFRLQQKLPSHSNQNQSSQLPLMQQLQLLQGQLLQDPKVSNLNRVSDQVDANGNISLLSVYQQMVAPFQPGQTEGASASSQNNDKNDQNVSNRSSANGKRTEAKCKQPSVQQNKPPAKKVVRNRDKSGKFHSGDPIPSKVSLQAPLLPSGLVGALADGQMPVYMPGGDSLHLNGCIIGSKTRWGRRDFILMEVDNEHEVVKKNPHMQFGYVVEAINGIDVKNFTNEVMQELLTTTRIDNIKTRSPMDDERERKSEWQRLKRMEKKVESV